MFRSPPGHKDSFDPARVSRAAAPATAPVRLEFEAPPATTLCSGYNVSVAPSILIAATILPSLRRNVRDEIFGAALSGLLSRACEDYNGPIRRERAQFRPPQLTEGAEREGCSASHA